MTKIRNFTLFISLALGYSVTAQIQISEVCSKNTTALIVDGETPDYIELHNTGVSSVSLGGYGLTDDVNNIRSWIMPDRTIAAGEYLIILADDEDKVDDYIHTNFKLSDGGEVLTLTAPDGSVLEELDVPGLDPDEAYSYIDGEWQKSYPSPGESNANSQYPTVPLPTVNLVSGLYDGPITVTFSTVVPTGVIEYYLDDLDDLEKTETTSLSLNIGTTTTICARADAPDQKQSELVCHTYVIGTDHDIPVISVITSDEDLFDPVDGLFQLGPNADDQFPYYGANYWSDREEEVYFQYFNAASENFYGHGDLQMHGGTQARTNPQKPFRLLAKEKYGQPLFEYPFFDQKPDINFYKRLVLRNAGGDYNVAHCRDGFLSTYLSEVGVNVDFTSYQPVAVYLNGDYYGLMALREKVDKHYLSSNYGTTDIDLLEERAVVIEGDSLEFLEQVQFIMDEDMGDPANYAVASTYVDVPSLIDYSLAQISFNNGDWPNNNIKYWRPHTSGGLWRYILFDMDASMGRWSWSQPDNNILSEKLGIPDESNPYVGIINGLLDNDNFRHQFLNRHQDLFNTAFASDQILSRFETFTDMIDSEMQRQLVLWSTTNYDEWTDTNLQVIRDYLTARPDHSTEHFVSHFDLAGTYTLAIESNVTSSLIDLNSLRDIPSLFEGQYFIDVPIQVTAVEIPGQSFMHWEVTIGGETTIVESATLEAAYSEDTRLRAVYELSTSTELVSGYVLTGHTLQLSLNNVLDKGIYYHIHNTMGQLLQSESIDNLPQGASIVHIPIAESISGLNVITFYQGADQYSIKLLVVE